jgi:predicted DNA-binding transcriptional regulator AlpA
MEVLTVKQLAAMLGMTPRQIYSMTETKTRTTTMRENPLPFVKLNGNLRFLLSDVEAWLLRERKAA